MLIALQPRYLITSICFQCPGFDGRFGGLKYRLRFGLRAEVLIRELSRFKNLSGLCVEEVYRHIKYLFKNLSSLALSSDEKALGIFKKKSPFKLQHDRKSYLCKNTPRCFSSQLSGGRTIVQFTDRKIKSTTNPSYCSKTKYIMLRAVAARGIYKM